MLRRVVSVAAVALAATIPAVAGSSAAAAPRAANCSMDMNAGHGHDTCGEHGKNARVVKGSRKIAVDARSFAFTLIEHCSV